MQIPKQILATKMPSGAKAVLSALWLAAEEDPPWVAPRQAELAEASGLCIRQVRHWLGYLRGRSAIRSEARVLLGRRFDGYGLARMIPPPLHPRKGAAAATAADRSAGVAKREVPHAPVDPIAEDLAQIAKHARRSDTHVQICERLLKARAPCSDGVWHRVKIFRRIERMAGELALVGKRMRAGEIVERWKRTR